jgi:hypothetical protein
VTVLYRQFRVYMVLGCLAVAVAVALLVMAAKKRR